MVFKNILSNIDKKYFIKSYIISGMLTFILWQFLNFHSPLLILTFILFPFATIVWDYLIEPLTGGVIITLSLPSMVMEQLKKYEFWKTIKIPVIYLLSILIVPVGFIYIILKAALNK